MGLSDADIEAMATAVVEAIGLACDRLHKRIVELEGGGIRYAGVWQRAQSYRRGDVTTFEGSMFIALNATAETPGKGGDWQLCVKQGRPGRDGQDLR
jgi:hypothetical protein